MRILIIAVLALVALVPVTALAGLASLTGEDAATAGPPPGTGAAIPPAYAAAFQAAAATCPGLPWTVLAGIGRVETDFGRSDSVSSAGAVGPMQFEPATFVEYAQPVPPGGVEPPTPEDPDDAIFAAAHLLCANGARNGSDVPGAVFAYNHSQRYVSEVLSYAESYAGRATTPSTAAAEVVDYALAQIGVPYRWGGETPGVGFDCSGLTQAAYAAAGISIPRTSEAQWSALPHLPLNGAQPGDLVFFDPGEFIAGLPGHVGIYIGDDEMVDAPHVGASVEVEHLADWPAPLGVARAMPGAFPGSWP